MTKSNKQTNKYRRRSLYPRPRVFDPPPGFTPSCPNPAWSAHPLTLYEQSQSLRDFLRELRNGVTGPSDEGGQGEKDPSVDLSGQAAPAERRGGGAGGRRDGSGIGIGGRTTESGPPKPLKDDSSFTWITESPGRLPRIQKSGGDTDKGIVGEHDKEPQNTSGDEGNDFNKEDGLGDSPVNDDPPTVFSNTPTPGSSPQDLVSPPKTPEQQKPPPSNLDPTLLSAAYEQRLAQQLQEFNATTSWPIRFEKDNISYTYQQHIDSDIERDEAGHYCLDLSEWDRCLMGKCGCCEICRPGYLR
ncbi:hypothetical protein E4T39_06211 [Aureobasidium subglaciale]|nr:hypothetical protein E4T39_06211 [Aureobasidium subglaciale]